jgi:predicted nucleotidyltransferase
VCGPGAFIVLKALAFHQRGENKDAYDLYFVIRNYGSGIDDVCKCLSPLLKEAETKSALEILSCDFVDPDSVGPSRVAQFQYNEPNPDLQADVAGYIRELLEKCS